MKRTKRKPFPYLRVAKLWERGKTIAEIAKAIGRIDKEREDGDQYHLCGTFYTECTASATRTRRRRSRSSPTGCRKPQ